MPIVTMPNGDRVQFPDDMSKDQIKEKIRSKFPEDVDSGWQLAADELKGAVRGVAKGVGKLAEELPTLGVPHVSELDPNAKQFLESPNATYGEAVGTFAGENAPFMVGGPEAAIGKGVAKAIPLAGKMAGPIGEFAGRSLWGGVAGAAQPVKEGESRLTNAAGGAATAGLLAPRVASKVAGAAGGTLAGLGFEEIVRRFGWAPVLGALGSLGIGAGHFGLGGLARKAARAAQYPGAVISNAIPAGVAGAAGGRAAESAQETYDANQPGPAQRQ
jgi:hypothetical protein